ncbi:ABC transporter permease [Streptomyces sp. CC219B]|uniref:ABC transporter permease n=1 Tax=Streptomyces sp. CC219B TaxID=3044574 RepID=UPI0024A7D804|nr:ABC transporter permease [Streptomyces sp. CC219B]
MLRLIALRAWTHRVLLGAVLLTVSLTTTVLAALTAYSGATGDAALRRSLAEERTAAEAALVVKAAVPADQRQAADDAVRDASRTLFDGLPLQVRTLLRSGPYALPPALRPASERNENPDLTHFAALDRTQVRTVAGRLPRPAATSGPLEVALPQSAARRLGLEPGDRLTVTDRLDGPAVRLLITGVYRPVDVRAPYWQLDDLAGRGVKESGFTTYGPLLTAPDVPASGRVSADASGWLVSADYSSLTTERIGALREGIRAGTAELRERPELSGATMASTALPEVLDRIERSLLVTRAGMLIVAAQLGLLAACALLLVAGLLSAERRSETRLLRARGATRARLAGQAALEAALIAVPAVIVAPLLSGPLTRLLVEQGALGRTGVRVDLPAWGRPEVWAVSVGVAALCALAVAVPAWRASFAGATARAGALAAPLRAGADIGLAVVAGVALWMLDSQRSGAVTADREGVLDVDPLLVLAPALVLLAGTVLVLRLLPLLARIGERLMTRGRGLTAAMVGWQFSRRPMRGAGPVLLLVISVALGVTAVGQGASWHRSQTDQADFRVGADLRVLASGGGGVGRTDVYADLPHVDATAPAVRGTMTLSGSRTATVMALDTAEATGVMLARSDLTDGPPLAGLAPRGAPPTGVEIPEGTDRLTLTATLHSSTPGSGADVTLTLRDRDGTSYEIPSGRLAADGRPHRLTPELNGARGPLALTGLELTTPQPFDRPHRHRLVLGALTATAGDRDAQRLALPTKWTTAIEAAPLYVPDDDALATHPRVTSTAPVTMTYSTGYQPPDMSPPAPPLEVRLKVTQPRPPEVVAVATDRFLTASGARVGQRVQVPFEGHSVPVRIVRTTDALPTTEATAQGGGALLVDLRAVNQALQARYGTGLTPNEWWLSSSAPDATAAAARALPDVDPKQVLVRDETAAELSDDPFGAAPEAALVAAAAVTVLFASLGFAVSAAGAIRARDGEFAVLRALGTPRRRLVRLIAAEHGVLVGLALLVGTALGAVLTYILVPLVILTGQATRPLPPVLVELPLLPLAALLTALAAGPTLVTVALALRRAKPLTTTLRDEVPQ